jgi:hypothetical protein
VAHRGAPGATRKHVGFESAAKEAAEGEGESIANGRKMIAAAAQNASKSAKAKNPRLKKVSGA